MGLLRLWSSSPISSGREFVPWISMFGVRAGTWMLSSRYPSGQLLSITSASRRASFSYSEGSLDLPSDLYSTLFVNPTILSKNPSHHGALDKLILHSTCNCASIVLISAFCWRSFSHFAVALKVFALSLIINVGFPLVAMNTFRHYLMVSASIFFTKSR